MTELTVAEAPRAPLPAAAARAGRGAVDTVGPVLAVVVLVAGAVLIRDALITMNAIGGRALVPAILGAVDGLSAQTWQFPAGAVLLLGGLWLVVVAVRPRPKRALAVRSGTGLFVSTRDVARLASDAAHEVGGVLRAQSTATRRRVTTTVHTTTTDPAVSEGAEQAIIRRLSYLESPPTVRIRVRPPHETDRRIV